MTLRDYKKEAIFAFSVFFMAIFTTWMVSKVITNAIINILPQACEMYMQIPLTSENKVDFSLYGPRI